MGQRCQGIINHNGQLYVIPLDGIPFAEQYKHMIRSFADKDTERLFHDEAVRRFQAFERQARRKLLLIDAATGLDDLRVPPGNRLEALSGDRDGQYSIRINRQWRICFRWDDGNADDVEIVDYH